MEQQTHRYDDIIDLPHHDSARHPQMPLADRAAQFSPFAALTGHEDAIQEVMVAYVLFSLRMVTFSLASIA